MILGLSPDNGTIGYRCSCQIAPYWNILRNKQKNRHLLIFTHYETKGENNRARSSVIKKHCLFGSAGKNHINLISLV